MIREGFLPFTQTKEYLSWHEAVGTKTFYKDFFRTGANNKDEIEFQLDGEQEKVLIGTAACVVLHLRIGKVLYCPYGPVFFGANSLEQKKIINKIYEFAKSEDCVFVRLELNIKDGKNGKVSSDLSSPPGEHPTPNQQLSYGLLSLFHFFRPPTKTFAKEGIFQPRAEWWLDLGEDLEMLLNRVHKDHRYSVRRAEREGVEVEIVKDNLEKHFDEFYNLLQITGERDGFMLYDKKYYEQVLRHVRGSKLKKFLAFTKLNGEYLSVALVVISHGIANLVFAGSKNEKRELGYNHLMQWEAIKESKLHNCQIYNFGGITDGVYGKPGLKGVTDFKKRFGGYKKLHGNFTDLPLKKFKYFLYILRKIF